MTTIKHQDGIALQVIQFMPGDYIAKNERRGRKCVITAQQTGQTVACREACIIEDCILEDKKKKFWHCTEWKFL